MIVRSRRDAPYLDIGVSTGASYGGQVGMLAAHFHQPPFTVTRAKRYRRMAIAFPDHGPAEKRLVYEHIFMVEWRRVQQDVKNILTKYPQDRRTNGHLGP
jgi:hypothetical protein